MPSLSAVRRPKVLPTILLFLLFSLRTIAAPFTPMIGRPIPKLNGGLNLYPPHQEDIEDYCFDDEDRNFDRDFHGPPRDKRLPQYRLMNKIHSGFIDEFQRAPKMNGHYDEQTNTGGDAFQRSSSNNVGGWGKVRATPVGRGRSPKIARITRKDGYRPNPTTVRVLNSRGKMTQWLISNVAYIYRVDSPNEIPSLALCSRRKFAISYSFPRAAPMS